MKTYTKIHKDKTVADAHVKKIIQRGGFVKIKPVSGGTSVEYYFPEKKNAPKPRKKRYDVISPDGFSIRMPDVPLFKSIEERDRYFEWWRKRYERQGYYSSVDYGRIPLEDLHRYCEWIEV